jgi:hypothetical protein
MNWEQIILVVVLVWALLLSCLYFKLSRRMTKLGKQPPKHTHFGEEILFATVAKNEKPAGQTS